VKYDGKEISVTMSVGIAGVLPGGETPEEALSAADNAMYRAKVNGRNCVALFRPYP
jgi:diguanylate cyclase (GGDEF)-like protein